MEGLVQLGYVDGTSLCPWRSISRLPRSKIDSIMRSLGPSASLKGRFGAWAFHRNPMKYYDCILHLYGNFYIHSAYFVLIPVILPLILSALLFRLMLALGTCQPLALVTSLVELSADVNEVAGGGITPACFAKSPEQVRITSRRSHGMHLLSLLSKYYVYDYIQ